MSDIKIIFRKILYAEHITTEEKNFFQKADLSAIDYMNNDSWYLPQQVLFKQIEENDLKNRISESTFNQWIEFIIKKKISSLFFNINDIFNINYFSDIHLNQIQKDYLKFYIPLEGIVIYIDLCGSTEFFGKYKEEGLNRRIDYFLSLINEHFILYAKETYQLYIDYIRLVGDEGMYFINLTNNENANKEDKLIDSFKHLMNLLHQVNKSNKPNIYYKSEPVDIRIRFGFCEELREVKINNAYDLRSADLIPIARINSFAFKNSIIFSDNLLDRLKLQENDIIELGQDIFKGYKNGDFITVYTLNYHIDTKDNNGKDVYISCFDKFEQEILMHIKGDFRKIKREHLVSYINIINKRYRNTG